jgi:hypothetical protein
MSYRKRFVTNSDHHTILKPLLVTTPKFLDNVFIVWQGNDLGRIEQFEFATNCQTKQKYQIHKIKVTSNLSHVNKQKRIFRHYQLNDRRKNICRQSPEICDLQLKHVS